MSGNIQLLPRLIRFRDAPAYLGMDRHRFNSEVRPNLMEIPIGKQGIAFDRLDLDAWVEHYKQRSGRPARSNFRSMEIWDEKKRQDFTNVTVPGISTKQSSDAEFQAVLARVISKKPKST